MDTSKHTPTPWYANLQPDGFFDIQDGPNLNTASVLCSRFEWPERKEEMHANAEFIVRACNAHDHLVAALQTILATKPQYGMNPQAIVGSPHGIDWNVHAIAREALDAAGAA
ncbi:hypothetical protein E7V67_011400 [[Empedobacter] haloabium]|uniref:Uncharacterized protein n=1 Tax=[Empedobacter] haloabium TaxID=592317 RepID=A0ABZ1UTR8_9BURK